jgi:hypothetical protein
MTKLKIVSLAGVAVAGMAASLMIQHKSQVTFRERDATMRQQDQQIAALTVEHQRLSNLVAQANSAPPDDHTAELAKLRRASEALKKQTNDLARKWGKSHETQPSGPASNPKSDTPEYYKQLHQMAGSKPMEARDLGLAFQEYARDHQNQSPSNLDQLVPYLAKNNRALSGSNQFEIIYQGSLDNLQGIPWHSVAVVREQQPWPGPDGRMTRLYGMMGGVGQAVASDDNFQSWEAKHVFSSPGAGQAGQ